MKIVFLISSTGDTNLAIKTINHLNLSKEHEFVLISLTQAAQKAQMQAIDFPNPDRVTALTLPELLQLKDNKFPETYTDVQCLKTAQYIQNQHFSLVYCGVPSDNSDAPFQIVSKLERIPVLIAYEFMFKPENHTLWRHLPVFRDNPDIHFALPLDRAKEDFLGQNNVHVVGHLSIDNGVSAKPLDLNSEEIRRKLDITDDESLVFISSTTQPVEIDEQFLDALCAELPNHPKMQVRLGLHPGIKDLDGYLTKIIAVYDKHKERCSQQFKIIFPDEFQKKLNNPELFVGHPVFLNAHVNGTQAAYAADRVAQAVPGALLNQGAIEGKGAYAHGGKPYLPQSSFAENLNLFFTAARKPYLTKTELYLEEKTVAERCSEVIMGMTCRY